MNRGVMQQNELNRLREDPCYIARRDVDTQKPLKFITYHYHPYGCSLDAGQAIGPNALYTDGAVSGCNIATESRLKISDTVLTHNKQRQELDSMRPNMPRIRGYQDVDSESVLIHSRFQDTHKNCIPTEVSFTDRGLVFVPLRHLCYNPQDVRHVVNDVPYRQGVSTRNQLKTYLLNTRK